ncbi:MAG: cobalt ECF transporter T component CbiQ [Methanomassiliicoccales archaeon]|nr:MAG: cobalt ECF transporter T component CbiQ [Methanomassiliicoccales archaeon]
MRHVTIDRYASHSSFYRLDPRAKIIAIIFSVIVVALLTDLLPLLISLMLGILLLLMSNIPIRHIFKRYAIALPFLSFASISLYFYSGLLPSFAMFIRISTCVLLLILLSSTTPFFDLLKASQHLKVPKLILVLCMFLYRYIFVFTEEYQRMRIARSARAFSGGKHLLDKRGMQTISSACGMLLVRAYQRGIRIYDALLCRGYDGEIRTLTSLRFKAFDYAFCANLMMFSSFVLYVDRMVIV